MDPIDLVQRGHHLPNEGISVGDVETESDSMRTQSSVMGVEPQHPRPGSASIVVNSESVGCTMRDSLQIRSDQIIEEGRIDFVLWRLAHGEVSQQ